MYVIYLQGHFFRNILFTLALHIHAPLKISYKTINNEVKV